ncbi:MAG: hypothetical protein A3A94_02800 [Candidatus Portnoybacteria bacterium RIFCSPLOWO2_01_FULL_43_11]|uniref:Ada DNA repair metal-binding domain-containing protein n=4 Tax=Candidatus Portnoyibacteriota TaxID=1817913 RepID=A0A1G2FAL8_9BACT|nr:MAG: hypothetical protein A2815_00875 [Candidatus Portnoybacteria bacterium RIFCSPHIGHO2_01_FULL_40_12b]OGZ36400.1 MAG: hypothetical protein A3D38_00925 [Candidatus Portnoybacteria bacterium RIFCSPHIGHO2_02_FULL_40_23]OGZ38491.1 MAG: hypothetical protein A3A94_02800 [Candidatus Portnoybacteria bacterium RIFCSPLOWO2_01_FULL_43_11]OGZ38667.1 MAG: hypothetical protein A3E90_03555 [Candidatus Portnoybacteria bacterium RIFCSPHIGHO2_12_FULL_40_11]OGZ40041.1 MAG: hypothetical protein A3I20_01475 [C
MLTKLINFVKKNEPDIVLVIGIILIALISFGAGRLTVFESNKEPISIQDPATTASIQQSLGASVKENNQSEPAKQGKFVGSINSDKYHWPWCPSAKNIKPENQIWFNSEAEAKAAGYKPDSNFYKLAPADYRQE